MPRIPPLALLIEKRASLWRRLVLPVTFVAGGLTFIALPSFLASRAGASANAPERLPSGPPIGYRDDGPVDLLRVEDMRYALDRIRADSRGVTYNISDDGRAQFILNRRAGPSEPEVHAEWDDLLVFQSGIGKVRFGGQLRGASLRGRKEKRGGELLGALTSTVEPGDVLRIPAGVPHQVEPLGDAPIVYLVVKLRAPLQPLLPDAAPGAFKSVPTDRKPPSGAPR